MKLEIKKQAVRKEKKKLQQNKDKLQKLKNDWEKKIQELMQEAQTS